MKSHNFTIVNLDTDSISFCKPNGESFSKEEQEELLKDLNSYFPDKIKWEHDGIYQMVVILKAKNYILKDEKGKVKIKGSSLKSSKIEKACSEIIKEIINTLLDAKESELVSIYNKYILEVNNLKDITRWASKRTLSEKTVSSTRKNEVDQMNAIADKNLSIGDKFRVYKTNDNKLKLEEDWDNDHDVSHLMKRIWSTFNIFKTVIKMDQFPRYHLKNKKIKEQLEFLLRENN